MTGLLDTHTFLWWATSSSRLSAPSRAFLLDPANTLLFSAASVWEMVIKIKVGKIQFHMPLSAILAQQQANGVQLLPVTVEHALAVESLPMIHRDPFDHLLIAQASVEQAVLVSADRVFDQYPVRRIW